MPYCLHAFRERTIELNIPCFLSPVLTGTKKRDMGADVAMQNQKCCSAAMNMKHALSEELKRSSPHFQLFAMERHNSVAIAIRFAQSIIGVGSGWPRSARRKELARSSPAFCLPAILSVPHLPIEIVPGAVCVGE
jgi:hypothetical protein